jgi:rhodanese-related sulfurtransferase
MQLSPLEVSEKLKSATPPRLLDVRQPEEHAFVALPESTLIPLGELAMRADELDDWRGDEIVVYCHHGIRSAQAVAHLRALGFEKAYNLAGGIDRWTSEVDPNLPRY